MRSALVVGRNVVLVGVALSFIGCRVLHRYHQTQTVANMRATATIIENIREKRPLRSADLTAAIERVGGGKDAWGTPLAFRMRASSYVLVSAGSDRRFDVSDLNAYFEMKPHDVRQDPRLDLVVRDGDLITVAGK